MLLNRFVSIPILFPLYNKSLVKARALCDLFKCSTVKHSHVAITASYATRWSIQGQQPEMRLLNMYQTCLVVDPRVRTSLLIRVSIRKTLKARCNKSRMQNFSEFPRRHHHKEAMLLSCLLPDIPNRSVLFSLHLTRITVPFTVQSTNDFLAAASWRETEKQNWFMRKVILKIHKVKVIWDSFCGNTLLFWYFTIYRLIVGLNRNH